MGTLKDILDNRSSESMAPLLRRDLINKLSGSIRQEAKDESRREERIGK